MSESLNPQEKLAARRQEAASRPTPEDRVRPQTEDHKEKVTRAVFNSEPFEHEFEGYIYEVDPTYFDSWELVVLMSKGEKPNAIDQLVGILGQDGYDSLIENVTEVHGYPSTTAIGNFLQEVSEVVEESGK